MKNRLNCYQRRQMKIRHDRRTLKADFLRLDANLTRWHYLYSGYKNPYLSPLVRRMCHLQAEVNMARFMAEYDDPTSERAKAMAAIEKEI